MEENAVLVLLDVGGHLKQRQDHGGRLGGGQGGVSERVGAERMVEDVSPHANRSRVALARKVVADVRSLWRSFFIALISFSQLPRAQYKSSYTC